MNYFEEEEQYMEAMNNAQMEQEYQRLAAEGDYEEQRLAEEERINSCKNEQNSNEQRSQVF
jgi:hypothetical protein